MQSDAGCATRSSGHHARAFRIGRSYRRIAALCVLAAASLAAHSAPADAQYFGRNKVQYERPDFRVLPTEHFEIYFYPVESLATADAARMAERWYHRHNAVFGRGFLANPLIFYADNPDFQQSNVIEDFIGQGTGDVTEGVRNRVIMPFTGVYAENDHVLGHELVHVFQYHVAQAERGGLSSMARLPLWFVEGMAEYMSVGRNDPNTAMWMRDALRRNDLPTIRKLETDPKYFPYRYGQALWAYIAGVWGDSAVARVFRAALTSGSERAIVSVLHVSEDSLGSAWHAALRAAYGAPDDRTSPDGVGRGVAVGTRPGDQNVSPSISPDGRYLAFFSSRSLFGFDVYVAESATGRIVKQLTSVTGDHRFDALSFIGTAGTWSPDGRKFAFAVYAEGNNEIDVVDVESGRTERRIRPAGIGAISDPAWSPDGSRIAFSGLSGGISDLFVFDLAKGTTVRLTNGREAELQPAWSPDGRSIAFVTDRSDGTDFEELSYGPMQLALIDVASHDVRVLSRFGTAKAINPQFSPDGTAIYFVSDQDGFSDVYRRTLATGEIVRITRIATGVSGITALSPALSVARTSGDIMFSVFDRTGFSIRALAPGAIAVASVTATSVTADAALLPPAAARGVSTIERAIAEARGGLPPATSKAAQPYKSGLFINHGRKPRRAGRPADPWATAGRRG